MMERCLEDDIATFFERGGSMKILYDVKNEDLETLYLYGSQCLSSGEMLPAQQAFFTLVSLDQWKFEYWFSLGLTYQALGQHENSVYCFCRSGILEPEDPRSSFHAGMSYQILGLDDYAEKALVAAVKWCEGAQKHEKLRARAIGFLNSLSRENHGRDRK